MKKTNFFLNRKIRQRILTKFSTNPFSPSEIGIPQKNPNESYVMTRNLTEC